jgi:glycosyltransferase involved in cell wall biosynthesis
VKDPIVASGAALAPRVLIVVNVPWFFVMHRLPIALMVRSRGVDVHVACGEGAGREEIEAAGLPFHRLPLTRRQFAPWSDAKTVFALVRLYRELRPDVVHHVTLKPVILGSVAARIAGVAGVINAFAGLGHAFGGTSVIARLRRAAIQRLIAMARKLPRQRAVFENPDDRDLLIQAGSVTREDAQVIAGIGVDTDEFPATAEPATPVCVLMACRMLREKGVPYFVEAARRLKKRGVMARFVLVGAPDPFNPGSLTEAELEVWHTEGIVEWLGFRRDMPQVVRASHVVCLPTYYREGVPRILIEGAASARPLVTTDMPGCREIVQHGINGLVVPPHDVDALEAALEQLISDAALRARLGAAGRSIAEQRFGLARVFEQFWTLYLAMGLPEKSR